MAQSARRRARGFAAMASDLEAVYRTAIGKFGSSSPTAVRAT
jgi:hypothetical protein